MFSGSVFDLLKQVISSWQVIVVTIAIILYIFIVNYAARSYHRPHNFKKISFKRKKPKPAPAPAVSSPEEAHADSNDELGLEEE